MEKEVMKMITEARVEAGYTRKQLADKARVHYVTLLLWESGKYLPTIKNLRLLAEAMNLDVIVQFKPKK